MSDSRFEGMRLSKARERADAEAKGEPWCEPADLGVAIEPGASSPHLSIGGQRAVLIFRIAQPDSSSDAGRPLARLVFHDAVAVRMGPPNDEAISGHRLWKSGLEMYQGHVVHNPAWAMESEARNRCHGNPVCVQVARSDRASRVTWVDRICAGLSHDLPDPEAALIEEEANRIL